MGRRPRRAGPTFLADGLELRAGLPLRESDFAGQALADAEEQVHVLLGPTQVPFGVVLVGRLVVVFGVVFINLLFRKGFAAQAALVLPGFLFPKGDFTR